MKVILSKDVPKVGKQYDVKDVATGYARNYLFPKGLAVPATPVALRQLQIQHVALARKEQHVQAGLETLVVRLERAPFVFAVKVNEKMEAFGSIHESQIAEKLQQNGFQVERNAIMLDAPLKKLGTYSVRIRLGADIVATVQVVLEKE